MLLQKRARNGIDALRVLSTTTFSSVWRPAPFSVVRMTPRTDAFLYQPVISVSRMEEPIACPIPSIVSTLNLDPNSSMSTSMRAKRDPVRSALRRSRRSNRSNRDFVRDVHAPDVFVPELGSQIILRFDSSLAIPGINFSVVTVLIVAVSVISLERHGLDII